jgi:hypothetical protein
MMHTNDARKRRTRMRNVNGVIPNWENSGNLITVEGREDRPRDGRAEDRANLNRAGGGTWGDMTKPLLRRPPNEEIQAQPEACRVGCPREYKTAAGRLPTGPRGVRHGRPY